MRKTRKENHTSPETLLDIGHYSSDVSFPRAYSGDLERASETIGQILGRIAD